MIYYLKICTKHLQYARHDLGSKCIMVSKMDCFYTGGAYGTLRNNRMYKCKITTVLRAAENVGKPIIGGCDLTE